MTIAIIGEFNPDYHLHIATNESIRHAERLLGEAFEAEWIATDRVDEVLANRSDQIDGIWIAPGSPYRSMQGALDMITFARTNGIPTLGTCGGFQHMIIEFARNVLKIEDAQHAEYDPYASRLVVNPLQCDLKGTPLTIDLIDRSSKVYTIYGTDSITEKYHCNFGLNPEYQPILEEHGFRTVGTDNHNEARILDLVNHPFFIATLFVPQDSSSPESPHPLVAAFLREVMEQRGMKGVAEDVEREIV